MTPFARTLVGLVGAVAINAAAHAQAQDPAPGQPREPDFGSALEREELIAAALARNPTVAAAEAVLRAARERATQAGSLEDPIAAIVVAPLSLGGSDASLGYELRVSQPLPTAGKRGLRRRIAERGVDVAEQGLAQTRLDLAATASTLFADYHLVSLHQGVIAEHVALLEAFQGVATARYAAGLAPQQAPLQAELELAQMLQEQVSLRAQRRVLAARINAVLHRSPDALLPPAAAPLLPAEREAAAADEISIALSGRPEARAQQAEIEARRAALDLARRGAYPDFEVMAGYSSMWDMPEHRLMVGVGVNLPIFRRRIKAEVAAAEAEVAAAEAERLRIDDASQASLVEAAARADEALQQIQLYHDRVLPAARDHIHATRAAFESGEQPMLALIEAERGLRSAELGYHEVVASYFRWSAQLERQLGRLPPAVSSVMREDREEHR